MNILQMVIWSIEPNVDKIMIQSVSIKNKIKIISMLDAIKIAIIVIFSFTILANIQPFYIGIDSLIYAWSGMQFLDGSWGFTNELIIESEGNEFLPFFWERSTNDRAISFAPSGIIVFAAVSYLVGGYYGLFYAGPIIAIVFLIIAERIATKLFGSFVGLVTLGLLAIDFELIKLSASFMTDIIFSLFVLLGIYFLVKFFHEQKSKLILLSSIFLAGSAFFRYTGMIYFPIEVVLVLSYFLFFGFIQKKEIITSPNSLVSKVK